jgi:hypothetical protein
MRKVTLKSLYKIILSLVIILRNGLSFRPRSLQDEMKEKGGGRTLSSSLLEETEARQPTGQAGPPAGQSGSPGEQAGSPGGQAGPPGGPASPVAGKTESGKGNAYSKPLTYKIIVLGESGVGNGSSFSEQATISSAQRNFFYVVIIILKK